MAKLEEGLPQTIRKQSRLELAKKLVDELPDNEKVVISFETRFDDRRDEYQFAWEPDPKIVDVTTNLKIRPVMEEPLMTFIPHPGYYKREHKGFWQKLKLAFSKKPVYTKE